MKSRWISGALVVVAIMNGTVTQGGEVKTKEIEYEHEGVKLVGYLAYDEEQVEKRGQLPGVLVIHEWWGLNDYAKKRARMLAELGYVAFALDMYGGGQSTTQREEASKKSGAFYGEVELARGRAQAGLKVLADQPMVDASRIGAIGYCFGGTMVQQLAYSGADVKAVVSFHGGLMAARPGDDEHIKASFLICHGAADSFVKAADIISFKAALDRAGADWMMISYSGAVHSFTNPNADQAGIEGVRYNEAADHRSWGHMQLFFEEKLGKGD